MRAVLSKGIIFLGLSLISFLPVALVAYSSNFNLNLASEISIAFAYVGVLFSIAYLGQRSYLAINAVQAEGIAIHAVFRSVNIAFAIIFLMLLCFAVEISFYVLGVVIAIKLSEAVIDLSAGYTTKIKGVDDSSKEYLFYAALRAVFLGGVFLVVPVPTEGNYLIHVAFGVCLFVYLFFKLIPIDLYFKEAKNYSFCSYRSQFNKVFGFGLAAITCSILTALPRLLLVGGGDVEVAAIALSAAPVSALLFQAIWLSNIKKLGSRERKNYFVFLVEILLVVLVVYFSSPIWEGLIPYIYGEDVAKRSDIFVGVILASILFFGAMSLVNIFKFEVPLLESAVYALSAVVYLIVYLFCGVSVANGLIYSAASMFLSIVVFLTFSMIRRR